MASPVTITRIQNRRGTQSEFDALYPPGYTGSGGVDINTYPGILLPGELALCTDTRSVYIGNTNGEYVRIADDISNTELLPLSLLLYPSPSYIPIPELSVSPTSFFNIDYSILDTETLNWNSPGTNFARNGTLAVTSLMPLLDSDDVTLNDTSTEMSKFPSSNYISFIASYNPNDTSIDILYKHNYPVPLRFNTSTKSWIPFVTSVPPVITAVAPPTGSAFGGTSVVITGENLLDLISLTFNGVPALNINVVDDSTITAVTPPGLVGPAQVEIITLAGVDNAQVYEYVATWPSILQSEVPGPASLASAGFAKSSDIYNDTLVVGAPDAATAAGSVVVYNRTGSTWTETQTITSTNQFANYRFGESVAVYGSTMVIGEPGNSDTFTDAGVVYVYTESAGTWSLFAQLSASDMSANSNFGHSVDIYGDTIVVGARGRNTNTGAVYVFRLELGVWVQEEILTASDADVNSNFGVCSIHMDTVAVGAPDALGTGSAYVFYRSAGIWGQQAQLLGADVTAGDSFGQSVSIYGDTVAVGSPHDDPVGTSSGSMYVFFRQGNTWDEQAKLVGSNVSFNDNFGYSVSVFENVIAVGAPYDDEAAEDFGSVYLYTREGETWTEQERLQALTTEGDDLFGYSISMHGTSLAVGSPYADGSVDDTGKVYIYIP